MKITYYTNYAEMSEGAEALIVSELKKKKESLLCCATGGSPLGLYQRMVKEHQSEPTLFEQMRILKLDEWGGIPMSDPNSCHTYLHKQLLEPLKISPEKYLAFDSEVKNLDDECKRIQQTIDNIGPIDICILGLGVNGHLGFNEPADFLQKDCHIAKLAATTIGHSMVQTMSTIPTFGMTVGMRGILSSKKILLLITGSGKQEVVKRLMTKEISTQLPASFLWLHANVECLIDKSCV